MTNEWVLAKGSCGLNVAGDVFGAYVNGIALFSFKWKSKSKSKSTKPFYSCVVTGHMTCGGGTLEEAQAKGLARALDAPGSEADQKMSRKEFNALIANNTRLPVAQF